jgi:hypothetical protein
MPDVAPTSGNAGEHMPENPEEWIGGEGRYQEHAALIEPARHGLRSMEDR